MTNHSSATVLRETPHVNRTTRTATIVDALKRRAQAVINDRSIDAQSRAIIRYALEIRGLLDSSAAPKPVKVTKMIRVNKRSKHWQK